MDSKGLFLAVGTGDRRWSQTMNMVPHHGLQGPAKARTLKGDRPGELAGACMCQDSYL